MKNITYPLFAALIGFSVASQAAVIDIAKDNTDITIAGQSYSSSDSTSFILTGNSLSDFTNVNLEFLAQGDFDVASEEFLTFKINGNLFEYKLFSDNTNVSDSMIQGDVNYIQLSVQNISLDSIWNDVVTDNEITIEWLNTAAVGDMDYISDYAATGDYVSYKITGQVSAVPEPSTYALMLAGLGLIGFMANRRKKA